MKIYFGFTMAGDRSSLDAARQIVAALEAQGHEVLTKRFLLDDAREADRRMSGRDVYARDMQWLDECDCFIAEVSGSSFGLGFEAGYVLGSTSKPVVLFYRRDRESAISILITGNAHPRCTLVPYGDVREAVASALIWCRAFRG